LALKTHITELSKKEYWAGLENSPEFVVAFIPSESLLSVALEENPSLLEDAFEKGVALASPVTLWAVLKTVSFAWRQETLSENAKKVFDLSSELYKRIATLANHFHNLGASIQKTTDNYNKFAGSLERNVLSQARKIDSMSKDKISEPKQIEDSVRKLTAPEFFEE
jgi:DNA recombination protein RmuC